MTVSDRLYTILSDNTAHQKQLLKLVGNPSSSLIVTTPTEEYITGIDLSEYTCVSKSISPYSTQQSKSTFSILV